MYIESTSGQLRSMTSGSSSDGFQIVSACDIYRVAQIKIPHREKRNFSTTV